MFISYLESSISYFMPKSCFRSRLLLVPRLCPIVFRHHVRQQCLHVAHEEYVPERTRPSGPSTGTFFEPQHEPIGDCRSDLALGHEPNLESCDQVRKILCDESQAVSEGNRSLASGCGSAAQRLRD